MSQRDLSELKTLTRRRLRLLWELEQAGGRMSEEDALTARLMREHPEWLDVWARADELSDAELEQAGVNPFLHITIHQVVLNQIEGALPAARDTFEALLAAGLDPHEAQHRIGEVLTRYIFEVAKQSGTFDEERYIRDLKRVAAKEFRPSRKRR